MVKNVVYAGNSPWIMWYILADAMKLIRFPFSDACDNIDTDFDVTVCFCKRWGIMCFNKLLICWQLLQKRKSEHPYCQFFRGSFTNWFDILIWQQQVGAECSNAAYSGKCGKGGYLGFSFPEKQFFSSNFEINQKVFLNIRKWGAGSRLWQKDR